MGALAMLVTAGVAEADARGWDYLIDRLVADGLDRGRVVDTFSDARVPAFTGLEFADRRPREPQTMYRGFLRASSLTAARRCRQRHAGAFERAERRYAVPADVIAAILHVETHCGANTGGSVILYRLARLAMANEPSNARRNLLRLAASDVDYDPDLAERVQQRARYLEDTFYPEVRAVFEVADRLGIDPLAIRGSSAGAFGYPQFLPTSFLRFATDGDGDGRISLYDVEDAAASCAAYLNGYGWRPGLSSKAQRQVIWHYNRSEAYIDAVLGLAARLSSPAMPAKPAAQQAKAGKSRGKSGSQAAAKPRRRPPG